MTLPEPTPSDLIPSERMQWLLEKLAMEDAGLGDPTQLSPVEGRALAEQTNQRWNTDLPEMTSTDFAVPASEGHTIECRLLSPSNANGLIMFIHGGGWALCSRDTHERAARLLGLESRAHVLTFDYRLAPEAPYPDGLKDCLTVWEAILGGHDKLRDCGRPSAVAGDSAGANLALSLLLSLQADGKTLPDAALLFYGVYDANFQTVSYCDQRDGPGLTREKMQRYWDWYVAKTDLRSTALVSPMQASDAQLLALPPLFLNAAAIDPLRSDTENLVRRLRSLGRKDPYILYPGVVHGFMQMSLELPEARLAATEAGRAFRELTGN